MGKNTATEQAKQDEQAARALAATPRGNPILTAEEAAKLQLEHRAIALREKAIELSGVIPTEFDMLSAEEKASFVDAAADALEEDKKGMPKLGATPKGDLIRVTKDGDTIDVHPAALQQHLELGWKQITA